MTAFTHEYLPLVSDYSRVLSTQQDSLASIYYSSAITCEYKSAQQELLASIFNSSIITGDYGEQRIPRAAQAQHASYLYVTHVFCKLGCELYRISIYTYAYLFKMIRLLIIQSLLHVFEANS